MTDTLSNKESDNLIDLGVKIRNDLGCDANGTGLPCRTDRLEAVSNMKRYLEIHDYDVWPKGFKKSRKPYRIMKSKSQREENE
jgi:hypothetical protein